MKDYDKLAKQIVHAIWEDCSGRRGIGDEFDGCDGDVKESIEDDWQNTIVEILRKAA